MKASEIDTVRGDVIRFHGEEFYLADEFYITGNQLEAVVVKADEEAFFSQQGWILPCRRLIWNLSDLDVLLLSRDLLSQLNFIHKKEPDIYIDWNDYDIMTGMMGNYWKLFHEKEET